MTDEQREKLIWYLNQDESQLSRLQLFEFRMLCIFKEKELSRLAEVTK